MKSSLIRISTLAVIAAAAAWSQQAQPSATSDQQAAEPKGLQGTWDVNVTVVDCQSGALIRNVHSLQMFTRDGSMTETTNTASRGPSVGAWYHAYGQTFGAAYSFFRYNPDGTFASMAKAVNNIVLTPDGGQFTVTATIQDFDANNNLISTGCVSQLAKRLQ